MTTTSEASQGTERWFFAGCEYDAPTRKLTVADRTQELTGQTVTLLELFLDSEGRILLREELKGALWPAIEVTNNSLDQAVSRLRQSLKGSTAPVIVSVPNMGYRLAVRALRGRRYQEDDPVPGRAHWLFQKRLGGDDANPVWLTRHEKTGELHVMKFASSPERIQSLRTELAVVRLLRQTVGDRDEFVPIVETSVEKPPIFVEMHYHGQNLRQWATDDEKAPDRLRETALPVRLRMIADLARAVAAAHGKGILHCDLKPSNILVSGAAEGGSTVRVADFGVASIADHSVLAQLDITDPGASHSAFRLKGSAPYIAPEVLTGAPCTARSDVYSLGVILYQMVVGDFNRPLAPGWEHEIQDPVLCQDIGEAACTDPDKRQVSAAELVDRLTSLELRRAERANALLAEKAAEAAQRRLERVHARRPWVIALIVALIIAAGGNFTLYRRAVRDRDTAQRIGRFLSDDLLALTSPLVSKAGETWVEAVEHAADDIDRSFPGQPLVAADLHKKIASALDNRAAYEAADKEYRRAATLYRTVQGPYSQNAIQSDLLLAAMQARRIDPQPMAEATTVYQQQLILLGHVSDPTADTRALQAYASGMILLNSSDAQGAIADLKAGVASAIARPPHDPRYLLTLEDLLAFAYTRTGEGAKAAPILDHLVTVSTLLRGARNGYTLLYRLQRMQAEMAAGNARTAIHLADSLQPDIAAVFGPGSEQSIIVLGARAQSEGDLMLWQAAIDDDLLLHAMGQGKSAFMASGSLSDASMAACRAGEFSRGEAMGHDALGIAQKQTPSNRGLMGSIYFSLATCYAGEGRALQAESLLRKVDIPAVEQLAADADWKADYDLLEAQIALEEHNNSLAHTDLLAARPACDKLTAQPYRARLWNILTRQLPAEDPLRLPKAPQR